MLKIQKRNKILSRAFTKFRALGIPEHMNEILVSELANQYDLETSIWKFDFKEGVNE